MWAHHSIPYLFVLLFLFLSYKCDGYIIAMILCSRRCMVGTWMCFSFFTSHPRGFFSSNQLEGNSNSKCPGCMLQNSAIFVSVFFFPQTGNYQDCRTLMEHIHHMIPTPLYNWLTNLGRSWNQPSEFLHRHKQNNHFGPNKQFEIDD